MSRQAVTKVTVASSLLHHTGQLPDWRRGGDGFHLRRRCLATAGWHEDAAGSAYPGLICEEGPDLDWNSLFFSRARSAVSTTCDPDELTPCMRPYCLNRPM